MITDLNQFLSSLNLTEKEITLYLASLRYGPQTASTLSKKTGIARSTVNFVIGELIKKGFASKNNHEKTTYFSAIQPESLEYILLEKAAETKKQLNEYHELLPLFNSLQNKQSSIPKVRYFEGVKGLCRLIGDCCEEDQTVLFISEHNTMHPKIKDYVNNVYLPAASKHKNKNKMIINKGPEAKEYAEKASQAYDEIIFNDPKKYSFTLTTAVYGDKVALCSYNPADLSGIIIENKLIADQMRTMFEITKKQLSGK